MAEYSVDRLVEAAIALSAHKDTDALLGLILKEAMAITSCDGGTVTVLEKGYLFYRQFVILSKQYDMTFLKEGEIPPIPLESRHVCALSAALHRKVNLEDVYQAEGFDLEEIRQADEKLDYRTKSMLIIPMEDERGNVLGILQLFNAMDEDGQTAPFRKKDESLVKALSSLAAVFLRNDILSQAVLDILHSFVAVMVDAIDARMPYNANHSTSMARYARRFLDWLDETGHPMRFDPEMKDPFVMSVWLHDIGKLAIPEEIMGKATRLGRLEVPIRHRIEVALLMERIRAAEHPEQAREAEEMMALLSEASEVIFTANDARVISVEMREKIESYAGTECLAADGSRIRLLSDKEKEALSIRQGTLTHAEREEIERHVVYTSRFLSKMKFQANYEKVPLWAGMHHELLDGSGYPDHARGEEIPTEVRLITILDIFDALTAEDRPYRPAATQQEAFDFLRTLVDKGKIDGKVLGAFIESGVWKKDE